MAVAAAAPKEMHLLFGELILARARAPAPIAVTDGPMADRSRSAALNKVGVQNGVAMYDAEKVNGVATGTAGFRWFSRKWASGYCVETNGPTDCSRDAFGSFGLQPHQLHNWSVAWSACRSFCLGCARCQYITVSLKFADCSWYAQCDLDQLKSKPVGFRSRRVRLAVPPALPQPQAPWTTGPYQQARASTSIRVYTYDFERAWSSRNRIGLPNSMQPFGPEIDEFGTTAASAPSYTTAVLALAAALRTSKPEEATLFFLPSPSGVVPQVDNGWCSRPHSMFSEYWKGTTDYFLRRGGHDHVTPRAQL